MFKIGRNGTHLRHDHILCLPDVLTIGLDDGLQELEVLDMTALSGYVVDKTMDDLLRNLIAQLDIVHVDMPHRLSF